MSREIMNNLIRMDRDILATNKEPEMGGSFNKENTNTH